MQRCSLSNFGMYRATYFVAPDGEEAAVTQMSQVFARTTRYRTAG